MNKFFLSLLPILLIFSTSCTSLKKVTAKNNRQPLNASTLSNLDGEYELFTRDKNDIALDYALTFKKYWWPDKSAPFTLAIKTLDDHHLQIKILKEGELIDTKIVKGKSEEGCFLVKKTTILPFYFILNGYRTMTTRIELLDSGDLSVDHSHYEVALLILLPVAGDNATAYELIFKKVKK